MTVICHCTKVSLKDLEDALEVFRLITYGDVPEKREDLVPLIPDYADGCCRRIFDRAIGNYATTGETSIFRRSSGNSAICSTAASRNYKWAVFLI